MNPNNRNEILEKVKFCLNSGNLTEAYDIINNGLKLEPGNYQLWNLKGITANAVGEKDSSIDAFKTAAKISPNNPEAYINMGIVLMNNSHLEEALESFRKGIEKQPENSSSHYNYALGLEASGEISEAIREYESAVSLNPNNHGAFTNLGMLYLLTGNYKKGFEFFEHRFYTGELLRKELPGVRWKGATAKEKTLYVYADQGFGDVIQFSRLLKRAHERVGKIYFECQEELYDLMKTLGGFDRLFISTPDFKAQAEYDLQIPLMSLPLALQLDEKSIPSEVPYLKASETKKDKWKMFFSHYRGLKVGITWRGNPVFRKNNLRSTTLDNFLKFKIPGVDLFSLQMNISEYEKKMMNKNGIVDISNLLSSFADTAAVVDSLDLIISTDTSLPHLSGALGKPTWLLLSAVPDWRWGLTGKSSPWYPTMRIFRQIKLNDWHVSFNEVKTELIEQLNSEMKK